MSLYDSVNYVLFTNPISVGLTSMAKQATGTILKPKQQNAVETVKVITEKTPLWKLAQESGPLVRLAGISGAAAVILGAYGAHKSYPEEKSQELKRIFETANRFHLIHSLALLGTPLCRCSILSGTFLSAGMLMFCGACYYHAFTGENRFGRVAPLGGTCLIIGWLAMVI